MKNLTKSLVESLEPKSKEFIVWDGKLSGFGIKVTPKGRKVYLLKYRNMAGQQRKPSIGVHGKKVTCEEARKIAKDWLYMLSQGEDPQNNREQQKAEMTFGKLFEKYLKRHAKPHKKRWEYDEGQYNRHIKQKLENKKISAITQQDIAHLHAYLAENSGKSTANHVLALITVIYNKAVEWGYFDKQSPTRFVKKYKEKSRDRFLQPDEAPRFFENLDMEENQTLKDFIYMLLLTGARKSNVLEMSWDEIGFKQKQWHIAETKNGESLILPLVPRAVEILEARRKANMESRFVFPSDSVTGHLINPKRAWARLLKNAKIENLTMHDLRRTMGSYQAMAGASSFIIGRSLGHKSSRSTDIYARLNIDPIRESMENATNTLLEIESVKND